MVAYKDILNTFGGDTSYADRFQAAALKWDQAWMSDIIREYKWVWDVWSTPTTPTTPTYTPQNQNQWNLGNWNYQDDSADRQEQIVSNLNEAYQKNPDQFKDWATFSQNFNYDTAWRSDKQKETMRNRYSQMQQGNIDYNDANNTDYFFNQLMWWWQISWEWAALDAARTRYKNYQYLSGMTPDQIASAIASNSINPVWQEMQDLKNYSPALYAQVQSAMQWQTQVNDINALWEWIYNWLTNTETNKNYTNYNFTTEYAKNASVIKQYNESLYKKIEWLGWDTAAYVAIVASMLQNPLIQANKDEVENLEWEIRKIQENIYTVWDTARSRLWSEAPEDLVSAYISQQTKDLQNQLRTAQNSLLVAQGKLNNQLTEVETMVDAINNWVKLYWEWWTWGWDYQFISGSKYQKAWYFNKKTWEFIPLGSTWTSWWWTSWGAWWWTWYVDTNNYQDDSQARLQQIANNLENLHNSNPELFNNRGTFNDYFKYNQRSAKQKQVLDSYWAKYGNKFSIWWTSWGWTWITISSENDKWRRLMWWIIAGDVAWWYGKTAVKAYWFERELNEQEVMTNIALICSPSEYSSLLKRLWTWAKKELNSAIDERIDDTIDANTSKIQSRLKSVNKKNRSVEAQKLAKELWINFWTKWEEHIMNYYNSL